MEKNFIIANEQGLHARPATLLVSKANRYKSDITLMFDGKSVDMKSIMGVLSLGIKRGSLITVITTGSDEVEAMQGISKQLAEFNLR